MTCTLFKVWRMGRTGHVSRREAGVWYTPRPNEMFGQLAVYNEICLENVLEADWVWILVEQFFGRDVCNRGTTERLTVIKQRERETMPGVPVRYALDERDYSVYYKYELMLIPKLHALGYDAVHFKTFGYLWVLPTRRVEYRYSGENNVILTAREISASIAPEKSAESRKTGVKPI